MLGFVGGMWRVCEGKGKTLRKGWVWRVNVESL